MFSKALLLPHFRSTIIAALLHIICNQPLHVHSTPYPPPCLLTHMSCVTSIAALHSIPSQSSSSLAVLGSLGCLCCGRHSEILSQGALPYFVDIQNCPEGTMWCWPKDLLQVGQSSAHMAGSGSTKACCRGHPWAPAGTETCHGTCGARLPSELRDEPFKLAGFLDNCRRHSRSCTQLQASSALV